MSEGLERLFDEIAGSYDRAHRRSVPCFEEFYGAALDLIPKERSGPFRVLDLGAGTGLLSAMVGRAFPKAEITLVDFSEGMMNVARSRLADEPDGRFTFHLMDYSREALPGEYEVVVSALSIHHVEDEGKRKVFREVHRVLADGGVLINADQIPGEAPGIEAGRHESHEPRHAREEGAGGEDASSALHRMETDKSSLEDQLAWMEDAGFAAVECRYKNNRFAVYSGRKGAS